MKITRVKKKRTKKDEKKCLICHRKKGLKYRGRSVCRACYEFYRTNLEVENSLTCLNDSVFCITNLSNGFNAWRICRKCRMNECRRFAVENIFALNVF